MANYEIVEHFISINGEGTRAGQLAFFLRLKGCNLSCRYCDTTWANHPDCDCLVMTEDEIVSIVQESGIQNVTITGGEPLNRADMDLLLTRLSNIPDIYIEIETNGSIDLLPYRNISEVIHFTMDYKLPYSGMESNMYTNNFNLMTLDDTVKFVIGSTTDLERTKEILTQFDLIGRVSIYLSPVFEAIEPKEIVAFMIENKWNQVQIQLQLHKFIWSPDQKGV